MVQFSPSTLAAASIHRCPNCLRAVYMLGRQHAGSADCASSITMLCSCTIYLDAEYPRCFTILHSCVSEVSVSIL